MQLIREEGKVKVIAIREKLFERVEVPFKSQQNGARNKSDDHFLCLGVRSASVKWW